MLVYMVIHALAQAVVLVEVLPVQRVSMMEWWRSWPFCSQRFHKQAWTPVCKHATGVVRKLSPMSCRVNNTWWSRWWSGWFSINVLSHWHEAAWVMLRYQMWHACICDTLNLHRQSMEQQELAMIQLKSNASTVESTFTAGCGVQWCTESMICWLDVASWPVSSPHTSRMRDTGISSTGVTVRSLWSSESLLEWVSGMSYQFSKKGSKCL